MTDLNTVTTALPPYILQPAIREPGYDEKIEEQIALFEGILDEPQLAALRRGLTKRNRPTEDVRAMVPILDQMNYKAREKWVCSLDPLYFINEFCQIYDNTQRVWIPFKLWDAQIEVLYCFETEQFVIILKARQNGLTWEALAWGLYTTQYRPIASVLLFSLSDREAMALLSQERFVGMYERLPDHIKTTKIHQHNAHFLRFTNGSNVTALPSTRGDSYTATLVVVDEADLVPNLPRLMRSAKPTIEAGGQMILLSRADKDRPNSRFKRIFRNAIKPNSGSRYHPIFLPWSAHPGRDLAWYDEVKADYFEESGSLDDLYANYPSNIEEALAPRTANKRLPPSALKACFSEGQPLQEHDAPIEHYSLIVYQEPVDGMRYYIGADCAEGLPLSHNSATIVVDERGVEVANLVDKIHPIDHARLMLRLAEWYNEADIMVENNFHGFTAISWLEDNGGHSLLARGYNDKVGWTSNNLGKNTLYNELDDLVRTQDCTIRDREVYLELQSIDFQTLRAPEGDFDDRADAYALAQVARVYDRWSSDITVMVMP